MGRDEGKGYVTQEGGVHRTVGAATMRVVVLSGFISHERTSLDPGTRVTLPRALALAQCHLGNARALTAEEEAADAAAAARPTPPGEVEHREPDAQVRDPRTRKR
jgi:hypothetical protein